MNQEGEEMGGLWPTYFWQLCVPMSMSPPLRPLRGERADTLNLFFVCPALVPKP